MDTGTQTGETSISTTPGGWQLELLLYTMRHVQEHAAQLNLFLGQNASGEASDWVPWAKVDE
ncbi:MAG: hypothetical protein ACRDHW_15045 [Ktedonobacteraceae bacterium]